MNYVTDGNHIRQIGKDHSLCGQEMPDDRPVHSLTLEELKQWKKCLACFTYTVYLLSIERDQNEE